MENRISTGRTLDIILKDIKANIESFNGTKDAIEKARLETSLKDLETEYNALSLYTAWTNFAESENPMVEFAKAYDYAVIGHQDKPVPTVVDGVKTIRHTRSLAEDKRRLLSVKDFVEWTEHRNASVAVSKDWRAKSEEARAAITAQWKKVLSGNGNTSSIGVGKMQKALQDMVDALVFISGAKGGNAVVVKSKTVRAAFAFCTQRKDGLKGSIMSESIWKKLQMDVLHASVANKEFAITFGDEDPETEAEAVETAAETSEE